MPLKSEPANEANASPATAGHSGNPRIGRWLIVLSAILWSTAGFFAKSPDFLIWPESSRGLVLAFWRAVFAITLLATMIRRPVWDPRLLVAGVIFTLMNGTYLTAMVRCEAGLAIWLQYSAPLWVALGSWWLLGERIRRQDLFPWGLSMSGVLFILLFRGTAGAPLDGVLLGLLSGVFLAGVVLCLRWLRDLDPAWVLTVNHAMTALVLLPVVLQSGQMPVGNQWWLLIGFGTLQMGLPYLIFARGVRGVTSNEASAILLLEPVVLPVWVWLAWRNHPDYAAPSWATLVGGSLILAGLVLRYRIWKLLDFRSRAETFPENV